MTSKKLEFQCKPVGNMTIRQLIDYSDEFSKFQKQVNKYADALALALKVAQSYIEGVTKGE